MNPQPAKNPAAQALGRMGGAANTPAQNKARRVNGQNGGRPAALGLTRPELRAVIALLAGTRTLEPDAVSALLKLRRGLRRPRA